MRISSKVFANVSRMSLSLRFNSNSHAVTKLRVPSDALDIEDRDPSSGECPYLPAKGFNIPPARPRPLRHVEE